MRLIRGNVIGNNGLEPQHEMYLNIHPPKRQCSCGDLEPQHEMYLNIRHFVLLLTRL